MEVNYEALNELGDYMSELSEHCWAAGWLAGTEDNLPQLAALALYLNRPVRWGRGFVYPSDARKLFRLQALAGSWVDYNMAITPGAPEYIPHDARFDIRWFKFVLTPHEQYRLSCSLIRWLRGLDRDSDYDNDYSDGACPVNAMPGFVFQPADVLSVLANNVVGAAYKHTLAADRNFEQYRAVAVWFDWREREWRLLGRYFCKMLGRRGVNPIMYYKEQVKAKKE